MKKLVLLFVLALAFSPLSLRAENCDQRRDNQGNNSGCKPSVKATEVAGVGFVAAALAGAAGYMFLRRHKKA